MCGRATLAIVVSRICMIIAAMTATVIRPRCLTGDESGRRPRSFGAGLCSAVAGVERRKPTVEAGALLQVDFDGCAQAGAQGHVDGIGEADADGTRWTTLTQLPVAFWAGKHREFGSGAGAEAGHLALEGLAGIGVERDRSPPRRRACGSRSVSLKFASTQLSAFSTRLRTGVAAGRHTGRPAGGRPGRRRRRPGARTSVFLRSSAAWSRFASAARTDRVLVGGDVGIAAKRGARRLRRSAWPAASACAADVHVVLGLIEARLRGDALREQVLLAV